MSNKPAVKVPSPVIEKTAPKLNKDGTPRAPKRDTVYLLLSSEGHQLFVDPHAGTARFLNSIEEIGKMAFDYPTDRYIREEIKIVNAPGRAFKVAS